MTGVAGVIAPSMVRAPEGPVPCARRADWRFLLPAPSGGRFDRLVLLGGDSRAAELLVTLGVAREVDLAATGTADAVVVLGNADPNIDVAVKLVRPGGVFYCEVDRRLPRRLALTPARLRRRLHAAGLVSTRLYWVIPGFDEPRRFIPLDVPAAADWYLRTIYRRFSLTRAVVASLAQSYVRGRSSRLAPFVPCFSVVATTPAAARPASVLEEETVRSAVHDRSVAVALLTSGQDDGSRVVLLPFEADRQSPTAVVKASRVPAFNAQTLREHDTLKGLERPSSSALYRTLPRPIGVSHWNGLAVSVEEYAPGPTVLVSTGRWGASSRQRMDDLRRVTEWLVQFHCECRLSSGYWLERHVREWVEAPLRLYRRAYGTGPAENRLFALTAMHADSLVGAPLPVVPEHGDFGPWNIHRDGDRVVVVDWELDSRRCRGRTGPPLTDLIYFVTHWSAAARGHRSEQANIKGFVDLFLTPAFPDCEFLEAARDALRTYMNRLAIGAGFLPVLNVVTWVRHALDQHDRAGVGRQRAGFAEYVRALASHAEQMFGAR